MKIRCLIVDDEPLARDRVRTLALAEPDLEVVAECKDGLEALTAMERHRPNLIFLDVQMPRLDGFGVIEATPPDLLVMVIFTTAHDAHAIRAFEVHALDYLLKPFKESRFRLAMARARAQLSSGPQRAAAAVQALAQHLQAQRSTEPRILVRSPERIVFLAARDIDYIESAGNYVVLHSGGERHVHRETMMALEKRLVGAGFLRLSRSVLANSERIRELQPLTGGQYCAILKSGARLTVTCGLRELKRHFDA
jgi:two-component system, LytTR family, response regulator